MEFVEGIPLTDLATRVQGLSEAKKAAAKRRILSRVSEAYGMMILKEGLFQVCLHKWVCAPLPIGAREASGIAGASLVSI